MIARVTRRPPIFLWAGADRKSMLGLWGSSGEVACAIRSASGSVRFSAEQPSPRLRLAKDSGRYSFADLRLTPAFAKSYGVASSRLYSLML